MLSSNNWCKQPAITPTITVTYPQPVPISVTQQSELAGNQHITILFTAATHERICIHIACIHQYQILISQDTPITRINASLLTRSIGSLVSIVGTVETASGNMATLHSSVIVTSVFFISRMTSQFVFSVLAASRILLGIIWLSCSYRRVVEVIGTVNNDGSVTMQYATGFDGTYSRFPSIHLF